MSADEQMDSATRRLKQIFLKKAISEGRGPEAIAKLNQLAINKRNMLQVQDQDIIGNFEAAAYEARKDRQETREIILECLSKTDFNREESPEIREYMMQDLTEQELTIDLLRSEGMPEDKLPKLSMALARLNAYERLNGKISGEDWDEWSDNDERIKRARNQARLILSQKVPAHTLN